MRIRDRAELITLKHISERDCRFVEAEPNITESGFIALVRTGKPILFKSFTVSPPWSKRDVLEPLAAADQSESHRLYNVFTRESDGHLMLTQGKCRKGKMGLLDFMNCDGYDYLLGIHGDGTGCCPIQRHPRDSRDPPLSCSVPRLVEWFENIWGARFDHQQFFMGKRYCFTDFQYDSYHNFYVCVSGKRIWTLAPPSLTRWLQSSSGKYGSSSSVVPHLDEFDSCPILKDFKFIDIELNPGDVLYVPSFWWHLVQSEPNGEEFTMAYNYFFSEKRTQIFQDLDRVLRRTDGYLRKMEGCIRGSRKSRTSTFSHPVTELVSGTRRTSNIRNQDEQWSARKRVKWIDEEVSFLQACLPQLAGQWNKILQLGAGVFSSTRTPADIYHKYLNIRNRALEGAAAEHPIISKVQ